MAPVEVGVYGAEVRFVADGIRACCSCLSLDDSLTASQGLKEASDPSRLGANFHLVVVCLGELESRSPLES